MPAVHRDTDQRFCKATTKVVGNSSVYVNNLLASVKNDPNSHLKGELNASVNNGTVYIENKLLVLLGSSAKPDRKGHTNPFASSGSPNVFACDSSGGSSGTEPPQQADAFTGDVFTLPTYEENRNLAGDDPVSPKKTPTPAQAGDSSSGSISPETEQALSENSQTVDTKSTFLLGITTGGSQDRVLVMTPDGSVARVGIGSIINGQRIVGVTEDGIILDGNTTVGVGQNIPAQ